MRMCKTSKWTVPVLIVAVLVASIVSAVNGHNGAPYNWLAVLAGLTYIGSIVWLRIRG